MQKLDVAITRERKATSTATRTFSTTHDLHMATADIEQHRPTLKTQISATKQGVETGSGNNL